MLYREPGEGSIHRFGRLGRPGWELSVLAGGDQALLAHVRPRPLARLLRPLHRLHLFKAAFGLLFLAGTVFEQLPAALIASILPASAHQRLVAGYIDDQAKTRCDHPGGERAVRAILTRLDPERGPTVGIVANRIGGIFVTALPQNNIFIAHDSLSQLDGEALAGLLAHELAHLHHNDAMAAVIRTEGNLGIFGAIINGPDRRYINLRFSGEEERIADEEAIAMMKRAHIRLAPAAAVIEQMRMSELQNTFYGEMERTMHFGMVDRSRRWAAAAAADRPDFPPLLSGDGADDLFNFCWVGKVPPRPSNATTALPKPPELTQPPGTG